jgi:hypothetical protein
MRKYSRVTAAEVLETFHSDSEYGLPNNSIPGLKKAHGPNKIAEEDEVRAGLIDNRILNPNSFAVVHLCRSILL